VDYLLVTAVALAWLVVSLALFSETARKYRRRVLDDDRTRQHREMLDRWEANRDLVRTLERERRSLNDALRVAFPEAPQPAPPTTRYHTHRRND
jgi:hypothetical protein